MTDRELARRARGRARRKLRRRRRRRNAAIAVIAFFTLGVFATTAFDVLAPARRLGPPLPILTGGRGPAFSLGGDSVILASTSIQLESTLPKLVDVERLFPSRSASRLEEALPREPDRPDLLVLEDFQASPAKRAFLEGVRETASLQLGELQNQAAIDEADFTPPSHELGGAPGYFGAPPPAVPEPGTGLLLAMGLAILSLRGRLASARTLRSGSLALVPPLSVLLLTLTTGCAHVEKQLEAKQESTRDTGRSSERIATYRDGAEAGTALSQYNLGLSYFYGEGVERDQRRGVELYRSAAEQSLPQAQYNLASALMNGEGVERDPLEAVTWFTAAARLGDADSQFNLGLLYLNGEFVEKDLEASARWFTWAAEQGHVKAQANLGVAYLKGRGVEKNAALAAELFEKAADEGHAQAQFNLAQAYEYGIGVPRHSPRATQWYETAADQGIPSAQFRAGLAYRNGRGVKQDSVVAYKWLALAADAGYFKAREPMQELEKNLSGGDLAKARKDVQKWNQKHFSAQEG